MQPVHACVCVLMTDPGPAFSGSEYPREHFCCNSSRNNEKEPQCCALYGITGGDFRIRHEELECGKIHRVHLRCIIRLLNNWEKMITSISIKKGKCLAYLETITSLDTSDSIFSLTEARPPPPAVI